MFALYSNIIRKKAQPKKTIPNSSFFNFTFSYVKIQYASIILSGVFLGLATLTKIPAFTMIPLIGYIIYTNNNKNFKTLGIWIVPVILIPLLWPAYAISIGEFNFWWDGVLFQTHREHVPLFDFSGQNGDSPLNVLLFRIDPLLMILGFASLVYIIIKRDLFLILWIVPLEIWLYFIGFSSFFHLIPLFPAFCISIAKMILDLTSKINNSSRRKILQYGIISGIAIFGLVNTTILITTNINATHFNATSFIAQHLHNNLNNSNNPDVDISIIKGESTPVWIFKEIYNKFIFAARYWENNANIYSNDHFCN